MKQQQYPFSDYSHQLGSARSSAGSFESRPVSHKQGEDSHHYQPSAQMMADQSHNSHTSIEGRLENNYEKSRSDSAHSFGGSSNSSKRRKGGIGLTKTLLKKISGMYTSTDFKNSHISSNRSKATDPHRETQVYEEYQLSDFDMVNSLPQNNHTNLSISNNPLSNFNDSVNWRKERLL